MFSFICRGRDRRKEGMELEQRGDLLQDRREVLAARPHHTYTQEGRRKALACIVSMKKVAQAIYM